MNKSLFWKGLFACFFLIASLSTPALSAQDLNDALVAQELRTLADSIDSLTKLLSERAQGNAQETSLRKLDIAIS